MESPHPSHVSRLIGEAVELAYESYDQNIHRNLSNPKLREAIEGYFPDDTYLTTEEVIDELEAQKANLLALAEKATDTDELLTLFDRYIRGRVDALFYENNDVRLAQIMRDFTDQFVMAAIGTMKPQGLMNGEQESHMRHLLKVYDTSISTAMHVHAEVRSRTGKEFGNLCDWAAQDLMNAKGEALIEQNERETIEAANSHPDIGGRTRAMFEELNKRHKKQRFKVHVTDEEIAAHAKEIFREIVNSRFGTTYQGESYPHPALYMVCALAQTAAQREVSNMIDPANPPSNEQVQELIQNRYEVHMHRVNQRFKEQPYQITFESVLQELEHTCNAAAHVPDDFREELNAAINAAHEVTQAALPRRFREWEREAKLNWSDGRNFSEMMDLQVGSFERTNTILQDRFKSWGKSMDQADTVEGVLEALDLASTRVLHNVTYACEEPAILLLMKDYVQSLHKSMMAMQKEHGLDSTRTREGFAALEKKLDCAYEAYRVNRDWCLDITHGAYDDFGLYAMLSRGNMAGKHYSQLSEEQKAEIPKFAVDLMRNASAEHFVPADLATNPMVPMLLEQCLERAERDYDREHPPEPDHMAFSDKVASADKLGKRATRQIEKRRDERQVQITGMALVLLDNVIEMFPGGEMPEKEPLYGKAPAADWRQPQFHAAGMQECMQFFEEARERGRVH